MDDHIGKHSTNDMRINTQRTTVNILVGGIEELLSVVFLLVSATEE
jgi:hypothetical protein